MSDQAGSSDHLTTAITQLRQYNKDERMDCQSQEKQDAGSQPGLALSNPHSATHMTGLDVAADSTSPSCAGEFTAAMGDDHEPEVLDNRPPNGSDNDDVVSAVETDYESSSSSSSSDVHAQRSRLLAISNLLSKEEVKQIKFLAKDEISNDRYAQISKAYEVFEELEKDGKFPFGDIAKLLVEVKRNDLASRLGIAVPLTEEEEEQAGASRQSLSARGNEPPASQSFPDPSQSSDSDTRPDTHDRGQHPRKQTSCSSRNREELQSSEEEYILSTSDDTDDSQISSSISSSDSASEVGSAGAHADQLLTSSADVTLPVPSGSTIIPSSDNMLPQAPKAEAESNSNSSNALHSNHSAQSAHAESASSQPPGFWEHLGARPKQIQQSASREPVPEIPVLNDGHCSDSESSDNEQLLALQQGRTSFNQILQRIQELERREQLSRGQRSTTERGNQYGREIQEALRRPQQEQEEAIPRSQLYRLWFPCCMQYYPCSSCHLRVCDKAGPVTHLMCSHYMYHDQNAEQQNDEGKTPSHNCALCNRCFNPEEETHLCEPDECCACSGFLDAFSGCQLLPCAHKIHEDCAIAMIQNGIHTCPICQRPIFDSPG